MCWSWGEPNNIVGFGSRPKGHIRGPKGNSALWKRPSKNPAVMDHAKKNVLVYLYMYLSTFYNLLKLPFPLPLFSPQGLA